MFHYSFRQVQCHHLWFSKFPGDGTVLTTCYPEFSAFALLVLSTLAPDLYSFLQILLTFYWEDCFFFFKYMMKIFTSRNCLKFCLQNKCFASCVGKMFKPVWIVFLFSFQNSAGHFLGPSQKWFHIGGQYWTTTLWKMQQVWKTNTKFSIFVQM